MKPVTIAALLLAGLPVVIACCKQDKFTSCCGKGKCNIFCCNCDGGCKPKEQCKGMDLPICWVIGGRRYCTKAHHALVGGLENAAQRVGLSDRDFVDRETELFDRRAGDDAQFYQVDIHKRGYFTYEEFLDFAGYTASAELRSYFDKFDANADGVITIDEMRN